jgi:Short C-terminal domain/Phospholipase_D-nuclease N-terminal
MPLLDLFWTTLWIFLFIMWIWLLISIFSDLFRDHDLSGWAKAFWALFLIVLPWLGALVYLIARGRAMNERAREQAAHNELAFRQYVQHAASSSPSPADELAKLADLRDRGAISEQEFAQAKARLLGAQPAPAANAQADRRASIG